ncbi:hypothetical protein P9112_009895 [Eukaryota sp. TZLM1-RC]
MHQTSSLPDDPQVQIDFLKNQLARRTKMMSEQRTDFYKQLIALKEMLFQKARLGPGYEPDQLPEFAPTVDGDADDIQRQFREAIAKAMEEKTKEMEKLAQEKEKDLQQQLSKYIEHCTKLSGSLKEKDAELKTAQNKTNSLEVSLKKEQSKTQDYSQLSDQFDEMEAENGRLKEKLESNITKVDQYSREIAELEGKLDEKERENGELKQNVEDYLSQISNLNAQIDKLKDQKELETGRLEAELSHLQASYKTLETKYNKLEEEFNDDSATVELEQKIQKLQEEKQLLEKEGRVEGQRVSELESTNSDLNARIEELEKKLADSQSSSNLESERITQLESLLTQAKTETEALRQENKQLVEQVNKPRTPLPEPDVTPTQHRETSPIFRKEIEYSEEVYDDIQKKEKDLVSATQNIVETTTKLRETDRELAEQEKEAMRLRESSVKFKSTLPMEDVVSSTGNLRTDLTHTDLLPSPHQKQHKNMEQLEVFDRLEARAKDMLDKISRRRAALERERRRQLEAVLSAVRLLLDPMPAARSTFTTKTPRNNMTPRPFAYRCTPQANDATKSFSAAITPGGQWTQVSPLYSSTGSPQVESTSKTPNYCSSCREFSVGDHHCDVTPRPGLTPRSGRRTYKRPVSAGEKTPVHLPEQKLVNLSMDLSKLSPAPDPSDSYSARSTARLRNSSLPSSLSSPHRAERREAILQLLSGNEEPVTNVYRFHGKGVSPRR